MLANNTTSCFVQIMDLVGDLFPFIFTKIEERCPKELESVRRQYPFHSLKVSIVWILRKKNLKVSFVLKIDDLCTKLVVSSANIETNLCRRDSNA